MTSASVAAMMASPRVHKEWAPRILSRKYDSSNRPAFQKSAITLGMGMTEKQGGTDVRANRSTAERVGEGVYRLSGTNKWFMSAPMSDAFIMLAQMPEGIGCFLVPRLLEDGTANGLQFQRLKDKLGNRSNASSEVEFVDAFGYLLGDAGGGVRTILDMVTLTRRLCCALASAGIMRASLAEAVHHCRGRSVFGKNLIDQPLMTRVLADMALDVAAATALSYRLAEAFDKPAAILPDAAYARVMTPVIKYWVCKIAPSLIYEAMECLGGNGYVEERPLARHYREAPVNAIWEGLATSWPSTCCASSRAAAAVISSKRSLPRWNAILGLVVARRRMCSEPRWRSPSGTKGPRAFWSSNWHSLPVPPNSSGSVPGRLPMRFSRRGLPAAGAPPTACSIRASMRPMWWTCSIRP